MNEENCSHDNLVSNSWKVCILALLTHKPSQRKLNTSDASQITIASGGTWQAVTPSINLAAGTIHQILSQKGVAQSR
ncbi:hypothetical protein E2C01_066467 [Portunus trituberculatus]|uniref:Uncharacterized protein n=1 Tax=Portunus trituberculatus TaxID=210409 RepID=A0A5B7HPV2_PORTR|nr:hypothetical protein [Portunus trituberculatus]